jgi:hypothetical protein
MIPKECKRLAEVDFPIATTSKHALKEKSVRFGHPSTFHLWWARRPLAACRAMGLLCCSRIHAILTARASSSSEHATFWLRFRVSLATKKMVSGMA